ncbi:MAG: hypothetical protein U0793_31240 [Gemmataceae bacterium]
MSEPLDSPELYKVSYSELVRGGLRELLQLAESRGLGPSFLAAAKEIDRLLHLYPQFGEPLRDLKLDSAQHWIGVVSPLVVRYLLDDEKRLVVVVEPFEALPESGL